MGNGGWTGLVKAFRSGRTHATPRRRAFRQQRGVGAVDMLGIFTLAILVTVTAGLGYRAHVDRELAPTSRAAGDSASPQPSSVPSVLRVRTKSPVPGTGGDCARYGDCPTTNEDAARKRDADLTRSRMKAIAAPTKPLPAGSEP